MRAVKRLNPEEARAWRGYRKMRAMLDLQVTRDLARNGLSDADYDVLSNLSEAEGRRLRLNELAARMLWSKSRLSHQLSRMESRGLVTRESLAGDARAAMVVLSDEGWRTVRRVAPSHVHAVRQHFIDLLTPEQIQVLADISDEVIAHLCAWEDDDLV